MKTSGYDKMFSGCTGLVTSPKTLPSTTMANWCYRTMFADCTSLTTAPEILVMNASSQQSFNGMFFGCTSLTTAPELPATYLYSAAYDGMFDGCTSLNYVKCLATNISASNCTRNWLNGVSATGTFVKDATMSSWRTGASGIPDGWQVVDA